MSKSPNASEGAPNLAETGMQDLECPCCGSSLANQPDLRGSSAGVLHCSGCGARHETVLGVPFLGEFEADDLLGLIEIASNAHERQLLAIDPAAVTRVDALCAAFHAAPDKAAFKAANEEARAFYFENRYHEWLAVQRLLEGEDLAGRQVLDIGAGQGFDAWRYALRGAKVTALEFSPLLCEAGARSFPTMRWIGGFAHALPFAAASFDYVFINAALHHMRDIPATIAEALRVLRPGGLLITSGDAFRPQAAGPELEYLVFDRHEAVLRGINEQIPRISDFLLTLERNRAILAPRVFTELLYGGDGGNGPDLDAWTAWDLDADAAMLKHRSGSVAMRVQLQQPWPHPRALQRGGVLAAARFAEWLDEPETALSNLARIMPKSVVDAPVPGEPTKFDLLNGWRVLQSTETTRTGYRRARLFRTRGEDAALELEFRSPQPASFIFLVNGRKVGTAAVGTDWTKAAIDLTSVEPDASCVVEIRRDGEAATFEDGCFQVRMVGRQGWIGAALALGAPGLAGSARQSLPVRLAAGLVRRVRRRLGV